MNHHLLVIIVFGVGVLIFVLIGLIQYLYERFINRQLDDLARRYDFSHMSRVGIWGIKRDPEPNPLSRRDGVGVWRHRLTKTIDNHLVSIYYSKFVSSGTSLGTTIVYNPDNVFTVRKVFFQIDGRTVHIEHVHAFFVKRIEQFILEHFATPEQFAHYFERVNRGEIAREDLSKAMNGFKVRIFVLSSVVIVAICIIAVAGWF